MKIALGVSGGIAAYKAAEIVRLLQDRGVRVQVVMTHAAQEFIRPLTFAALSGEKVITDMFGAGADEHANIDSAVEHIAVAQAIDALLVAPATADVLAKFAQGIASDFLSTLYLATTAPVVVAPAMNVNMWDHPATQANLEILKKRGVRIVEPGAGYLACGMTGPGRLADNEVIVGATLEALGASQELAGETVLITAGPTREKIDPVRYLTNRSSGKMGYALAEAALRRGAHLTLLVDQKLNDGIAVPFFGRNAMTAPALALLALHFDCAVVPARVERLRGAHFRLTLDPPLAVRRSGERAADVAALMAAVNRTLEGWIRESPEQWFWVHSRWPD